MSILLAVAIGLHAGLALAAPPPSIEIQSPGFPASRMDAEGRLVEDWGTVGFKLSGAGVTDGKVQLQSVKLDGVIPAAQATSTRGAVRLTTTAYRAPAHPAGLDVLIAEVCETAGKAGKAVLTLDLPAKARLGMRTVKLGTRTVLALPVDGDRGREIRDWGSCDDSTAMPGWAKPAVPCDPAFRNIRAGMGGTPIVYRFRIAPGSKAQVALGFCESHWKEPGRRPLLCRVEGATPQTIDPVKTWGVHRPGALVFAAKDENGDGRLEISVSGVTGATDRNPILNAIWVFPPQKRFPVEEIIAGKHNKAALRCVSVGGPGDQSLYPPDKIEYQLDLQPGEARQLAWIVACPGATAPIPPGTAWTPISLKAAALAVFGK